MDGEGVDQISLLAAETLYKNDWAAAQWEAANRSAELAADLYRRAGKAYLKPLREAEVTTEAADFLHNPTEQDYENMVNVHNSIVNDISSAKNTAQQDGLLSLKWQAQAWTHTMEAYFRSTEYRAGTIISNRFKERDLSALPPGVLNGNDASAVKSVCAGEVDLGDLAYPQRWADQRLIGAVVVSLDFDNNGKVNNSKILADVPPGIFSDTVKESVNSFSWNVKPGVNKDTCNLAQNNVIRVVGFWQNCADIFSRDDCSRAVTHSARQGNNPANVVPDK